MSEDEARDWLASQFPYAAIVKLELFVTLLRDEAERQNLIARSTLDHIWSRHIVDSAQLVPLGYSNGNWLDVGSGGGLPGIVIAILRDQPIHMYEIRRKRVDFLETATDALGLANARIGHGKPQSLPMKANVVSARAVASIHDLFNWTKDCVSRETRYVLPRGRSWAEELENVRHAWHGRFHVEHSLTDPDSGIVVADAVVAR